METTGKTAQENKWNDSKKVELMKQILRVNFDHPGVMLLMLIAVLEPEVSSKVFLEYATNKGWLPDLT